jgi:hypothetical protein
MNGNGEKFEAIRRVVLDELELRREELTDDDGMTSFSLRVFLGKDFGDPVETVFNKESKRRISRQKQIA